MSISRPVISIIGIGGTMGRALAARLSDAGYDVHGYDPAVVADGHRRHGTARAAVVASQVVILAVPYAVEQRLGTELSDVLRDHVVVSMTNPLTPTMDDVVTADHDSAAEQLARAVPNARIVKALNTIGAASLDDRSVMLDTFVAADDTTAADLVIGIIASIGFRPWFVGGLILSRTLERMTALIIGVSMRYRLTGAVGWRIIGETEGTSDA
jgi:8-hydroxy-5-deazaflavin:NADPH oxidoreductase